VQRAIWTQRTLFNHITLDADTHGKVVALPRATRMNCHRQRMTRRRVQIARRASGNWACNPPFVLSAAAWAFRSESEATCSVEHRHASDCIALVQGPSLRFRFFCPEPSTLSRPHPPHSRAQHNFIARRLICAAFAVRERLGDPRAVPRFCLSILPSMSSSTSPGSRPLHASSSFAVRIYLRRGVIGSALPMLAISGLTGSPLLRPAELLASLLGDFYFRASNGLVTLPVAGYDYGGNWTISTAVAVHPRRSW